ncbi:MAG: DUF2147 domain-containing protein [Proteobacteria bacterium]|nr:DUF2147 domain-containing protein [Pseudomonadota bacterium]
MTKIGRIWLVVACFAVVVASDSGANAEVKGKWLTEGGKSHVIIEPCGEKLCGEIVWLREPNNNDGSAKRDINNENEALRTRSIVGLKLLSNFSEKAAGKWEGGKIYNPEDGKTYNSKLEIADPDTLKVNGCVFIFCKTQTWTRAK